MLFFVVVVFNIKGRELDHVKNSVFLYKPHIQVNCSMVTYISYIKQESVGGKKNTCEYIVHVTTGTSYLYHCTFASNSEKKKKKIRTFVYRAVEKEKCKTSELLCLL